ISPVPAKPSRADIEAAKALLLEQAFADFPFTGPSERAHFVALLLLPFVRGMIDGPTPLHLVEKPAPGTGATLLVDVASLIATGNHAPTMTEGKDDHEWERQLTARLRGSPTIVLIDNIRTGLDSAVLSSAITSQVYEGRILGLSEMARIPIN